LNSKRNDETNINLIPKSTKMKKPKYIIDYVTKWVEAKALTKSIEKVVVEFLFENIFVRYGMPKEIVIDGGPQFTFQMIATLTKKYNILHRVTSP